jgi:hypothetical protein
MDRAAIAARVLGIAFHRTRQKLWTLSSGNTHQLDVSYRPLRAWVRESFIFRLKKSLID